MEIKKLIPLVLYSYLIFGIKRLKLASNKYRKFTGQALVTGFRTIKEGDIRVVNNKFNLSENRINI